MSKIIVRSAKSTHLEAALRILMDLRVSHSKADKQDEMATGREGHERKRRELFLHKQRRGFRSWQKFLADASESYDEFKLQKFEQKQAERLEK